MAASTAGEMLGVGPECGMSCTSSATFDISAPPTDLSELAHAFLLQSVLY